MDNKKKKRLISEERPWMKYYSEDVQNEPIPQETIYRHLKNTNKDRLDATALNYYGTKITHRELLKDIDECAKAFVAQGVKEGDLVSFLTVAVPECVTAIYALNKIGATANTIDPRMDIDSIRDRVQESGSKIMVTIDLAFPKVKAIMKDIKQDRIIVQSATRSLSPVKRFAMKLKVKTNVEYSSTVITWDDFLAGGKGKKVVEAPYRGDATAVITYTGGTTGLPKGVMLTNDSMNAVAFNFKHAGLYVNDGDTFLGIIPVFTSYGVVCGMHMPLCMRIELILIPKFEPPKFGKLVKQLKPNHMISTPAFYEILMNSKEMKGMDLSFLITLGSGGDTMNQGLELKLKKFMKEHNIRYPLAQGYGMSEVSAAASFCVNDIYKRGSVGIPSVATNIGIFDTETRHELGYNQMGEICITGPTMMKGYYQKEAATRHVMRLHDDGQLWIHSGDIGYIDEDGFLFVKGRVKRMITRFDGHKVFPVSIESFVAKHKSVRNCCTIGVRDRDRDQGHYPLVLVELKEDVDRKMACKEIFEDCLERLEERGQPVGVVAVDKIPLTGVGKNDYRTLEKEYEDFDYTKLV